MFQTMPKLSLIAAPPRRLSGLVRQREPHPSVWLSKGSLPGRGLERGFHWENTGEDKYSSRKVRHREVPVPAPCPDSPGGGGSREHAATSLLQPLPPSLRPSGLSGPPGGSNDLAAAIFFGGPVSRHIPVLCSFFCKVLDGSALKSNPRPLFALAKTDKSSRQVRKSCGSACSVILLGLHNGIGIVNLKSIADHNGSAVSPPQFTKFLNLFCIEIFADKLQSGSIN